MARALGDRSQVQRVVEAIEDGLSTREAARRFSIGHCDGGRLASALAGKWRREAAAAGVIPAGRSSTRTRRFILALVEETKDITLKGESPNGSPPSVASRLCPSTPLSLLRSSGQSTFKKRLRTPQSRNRPDVLAARKELVREPTRPRPRAADLHRRNGPVNERRPACAAGDSTRRTVPRCRAPRPLAKRPPVHRRSDGKRPYRALAPGRGHGWRTPSERMSRRPQSRNSPPRDVVVMDNLPAHKVAGVREAIEAAGAVVLYLPPYSPDFNPNRARLRQSLKALLRKGPPAARFQASGTPSQKSSMPSLQDAVPTPFLQNAGYDCE